MHILKLFLIPFSLLYRLITDLRNWLYDREILKPVSFPMPIIGVGNLTVGGTGKTPHVEYLIRMLKSRFRVATLSRGYGRKTKGYLLAGQNTQAQDIGDEPLQYFSKFSDITVAVCEQRVEGVNQLLKDKPETQVILLDDAFQHRKIKPGLNILLTEYNKLFTDNDLLPVGTLRESKKGMKRADVIIVTKTPFILSPMERRRIVSLIRPLPHQKLFFSQILYGEFLPTWEVPDTYSIGKDYYFQRHYTLLLVTGIANPTPLENYLKDSGAKVEMLKFPDHHPYSAEDIDKIQQKFSEIRNPNKIILTTEKDFMRLKKADLIEKARAMKFYYIPIEIAFHDEDGKKFNQVLEHFLAGFSPDPLKADR